MSTIVREPYPESKKLSKSNVTMWKHYMGYKMMDWPNLGLAINSQRLIVTPSGLTPQYAAMHSFRLLL